MSRRDEIIRMAREAGFATGTRDCADGSSSIPYAAPIATGTCLPELERFAALVAAAKQEQCLAIVSAPHWKPAVRTELAKRAAAIRALKDGEE